MSTVALPKLGPVYDVQRRVDQTYLEHKTKVYEETDRLMAVLMLAQWVFGIVVAIFVSPRVWNGTASQIHIHLYAAVFLGGLITLMPVLLVRLMPGATLTRHVIAVSQILWSVLLIHLTGGRIETHFHIFGSLAFLAFYRDWKVIVTATVVVAADHIIRGTFYPESVFGVATSDHWRWIEHAGWVVFEDVILLFSIHRGNRELMAISERQVRVEDAKELTEIEVQERTAELRIANEAKSEFLANMSHEIRTPMNGVIGMAELLKPASLSEDERSYLDTIIDSADSLLSIINDILDFSKIEAGKLEFESIPFNLIDTVELVGRLNSTAAHRKGLEFLISLPYDLPQLVGDEGRIRQVLMNLTGNAIKFTTEGEVSLVVEMESRTEDLATLKISVIDTGIGIPADRKDAIFDGFTQGDSSTTRRFGGTGLGLSISQRLVELMGGVIGVSSEPGLGSEFWVRIQLPIQTEIQEPEQISELKDLGKLRVLVVDDNATNRKFLAASLSAWSAEFVLCESGAEALAKLAEPGIPFDIVLMDHQMPEMDGIEAASRIVAAFGDQAPRIIVLSSALDYDSKREFTAVGVEACLLKPLRQSELIRALLHAANGPVVSRKPEIASMPQFGLNVLLAEDNLINQKVATAVLRRLGCRVVVAENGLEVLEFIQQERFDLILMDIHMPEMDGFETVKAIRALERGGDRHIPVCAMTAAAREGDRLECLKAGMDDYISKPFRHAQLIEVLTKWAPVKHVANAA